MLLRATTEAYGGSQARAPITATAAGLHHSHSNAGSSLGCDLHCSSRQHRILNPLGESRDGTHNLMVPSRIRFCCATTETPFFFLVFLGHHQWHMEISRLGVVESELHLPVYTTTIATRHPSHVCNLHSSSQQYWIFSPLNKAGDQTLVLMDTSRVCYH